MAWEEAGAAETDAKAGARSRRGDAIASCDCLRMICAGSVVPSLQQERQKNVEERNAGALSIKSSESGVESEVGFSLSHAHSRFHSLRALIYCIDPP